MQKEDQKFCILWDGSTIGQNGKNMEIISRKTRQMIGKSECGCESACVRAGVKLCEYVSVCVLRE